MLAETLARGEYPERAVLAYIKIRRACRNHKSHADEVSFRNGWNGRERIELIASDTHRIPTCMLSLRL